MPTGVMRHIYLIILTVALSIASRAAFAAEPLHRTSAMRLVNVAYLPATVEQNCLLIDKHGMLWLGTNSGVKSYDGYRFVTYRSDAMSPGLLPNNSVLSLAEDKGDRLWIGTRNGLVCCTPDKRTFTYLDADNTVAIDSDGKRQRL